MIKGIQRQQKILKNDKNTKQAELSQHMDTGSSCLLLHVFEAKSMRNATGVHGSKHKLYPTPEAWGLTFKSLLLSDPDRSLSNLWFFFLQHDSVWCIASWQKGTLCLGHLNQTNQWNRLTKSSFSEVCLSWPEIHWNRKEMERSPHLIYRNMQGTMVQSANTWSFLSYKHD